MSRKKNRKGGLIGVRKDPDFKAKRVLPPDTAAKGKGRKSGSRQQEDKKVLQSVKKAEVKDKRLGSKTPVALINPAQVQLAPKPKAKPTPKKNPVLALSPEQELQALEQDERLNDLIDRLDNGENLSATDQSWLDQRLDRHRELLAELGLLEDDEEDESIDDDDALWNSFNKASLDDYKD